MAWTKAKMAVAVGASVLLAAGTATVVVTKISQEQLPKITNEMWMVDWDTMKKLPPVLILRPSQFPNQPTWMRSEGRCVLRNQWFGSVFDIAYPSPGAARRIHSDLILSPGYDQSNLNKAKLTNGFDLMLTLTNQPIEKLRHEIMKQFGLTARIKTMETNVFLLKTKRQPAPGLTPGDKEAHSFDVGENVDHGFVMKNTTGVGYLSEWLERIFQTPVLDGTNLKGLYNVSLHYDPQELLQLVAKRGFDKRGEAEQELVRKALLDQLGLELVPSREPVEMLVVERVK